MAAFSRALVLFPGSLAAAVAAGAAMATPAPCTAVNGRAPGTSSSGGGEGGQRGAAPTASAAVSGSGGAGGEVQFTDAGDGAPGCALSCAPDFHTVVDCDGVVVASCSGVEGCDVSTGACSNACASAVTHRQSVGCEYYATNMDQFKPDRCFAAVVANTWDTPVHLAVDYAGEVLTPASFAFIPAGVGPSLTYAPYDPIAGLAPGQVAILFLAGSDASSVPCPRPSAVQTGSQMFHQSGVGASFHLTTEVPVVAYEINPYGGGSAAVTGASLLLPTSVWDTNYVAVTASPQGADDPSINIIAAQDGTTVTMLPVAAVQGGGALPPGAANTPYVFTLDKGQQAQLSQPADLTGSILQADKPIGFMAGQQCMNAPQGVDYCDHGEQMVPPVKALGSEYVGVMFRPRVSGDQAIWHLVGAVDGTLLTYSTAVGGPAALAAGQALDFVTEVPFTVTSQDDDHPFMLFTYMSGSAWKPGMKGYGDADFVISVPPRQYMSEYVFFADPTYPETNLVVVRAAGSGGFSDVTLDCAGALTGWQPVGAYEWTRIDLIRHDFESQGTCSTGRHRIKSAGRFGLWVWGWGSPETVTFTKNVSYGYPGGMNVQPINQVVIPPLPK